MSSGQWEVVGKSKKSQSGKTKSIKEEEKKPTKNGPKVNDNGSYSQPKKYYEGMEIDDTTTPSKDKKNGEKKSKKKSEPPKPKPPKTLEEAFDSIDVSELTNIITTNKYRFSNAPLVWLKEIANHLNSKTQIEVGDPTFSSFEPAYPLSIVPTDLKNTLVNVLLEAEKANTQIFFDVTLTTLANDMSRGQLVNGHRLLLQILALEYPEFCISSLQKNSSLRNSYQNRPPIGLTLLWALGQGGVKNFEVGFKVWQELFVPIIELKSYTKYVIAYLSDLLDRHANEVKISQDQLLGMFDLINSKKNSLTKDCSNDLIKQLIKFKNIYFNLVGTKQQVTFNQLMKKLPNQYLTTAILDPYNKAILESLVDCLERDDSCNSTWRQLFNKCSKQSATFIEYIHENWKDVSPKLKRKSLKVTVEQFKEVSGETLRGKKKDETVAKTNKLCQDILDRMKKNTVSFPWFRITLCMFIGFAGLITLDVSRAGNLPKSTTGQILQNVGLLEQTQYGWQKTMSSSARGYLWLETNAPLYYVQAVEYSKPYAELTKDVCIVALKKGGKLYENIKEYVVEKTPIVLATIEEYVPGAVDAVQKNTNNAYTTIKSFVCQKYQSTMDYLQTNIFIGEWAPEKLQSKTEVALNATRNHVTSYYHWFREQVHVYSEIP